MNTITTPASAMASSVAATAPIAAADKAVPPLPIVGALDDGAAATTQDGIIATANTDSADSGALIIDNYIIEGIDASSPEHIRLHAHAFYTALLPKFESATHHSCKISSKSKYNRIVEGLVRVRNGESLAELRKEFSQIHRWNKIYAVLVAGDSQILVTRAIPTGTDETGKKTVVDTNATAAAAADAEHDGVVYRITYIERVFCDILDIHGNKHIKGRTLYARVRDKLHNVSRLTCKLFTDTCPRCIDRKLHGLDGIRDPEEEEEEEDVVNAKNFKAELHCKSWIRLRTAKEFSRLLYPNPVCFLSTAQSSTASVAARPEKPAATAIEMTSNRLKLQQQNAGNNVMVLSWLTPTNNLGRFMFSINKSRYTASLLAPVDITLSSQDIPRDISNSYQTGIEFILSVPTRGMEQIVLDTGSISGRYGSKFESEIPADRGNQSTNNDSSDLGSVDPISNRKRKKLKQQQLSSQGVAGLIPIPYCGDSSPSSPQTSLFAIDGTVAHMKCRTYGIMPQTMSDTRLSTANNEDDETRQPIIDHDHLIVFAEVVEAFVHPLYWDDKKFIFCPTTEDVPPYLTFLGAQTFGYVKTS